MRVKYKYCSEVIEFNEKSNVILVLENQKIYRNTVIQLNKGNQEDWFVISKNYKPVDYLKNSLFVEDILSFTLNDKKLSAKLNSDIEEVANSICFEDLQTIKTELLSLGLILSEKFDFNIEYNENIETSALLKLLSFKPRNDCDNLLDKLSRFFVLLKNYLGISLFFTKNLYLYFSEREVAQLFETLAYNQIYLIDIEPRCTFKTTEHSQIVIIDKDLCEVIDK